MFGGAPPLNVTVRMGSSGSDGVGDALGLTLGNGVRDASAEVGEGGSTLLIPINAPPSSASTAKPISSRSAAELDGR